MAASDWHELMTPQVVGGIVATVAGFGYYLRRERSEKAKTIADVAAADASTTSSNSYGKQIKELTDALTEANKKIDALSVEVSHLRADVAQLDAGRKGAVHLLRAVKLCDGCLTKYGDLVKEIEELLKGASHGPR